MKSALVSIPLLLVVAAFGEGCASVPERGQELPDPTVVEHRGFDPQSGPIYFGFDNDTPVGHNLRTLRHVAKEMKKNKRARLLITGHADARGGSEYNLALGERRAQMARNYLILLGVADDRMRVLSYGEERPAIEGGTEMAHSLNRRDEFFFDASHPNTFADSGRGLARAARARQGR